MSCDNCTNKCDRDKLKCIPYAAYEIAMAKAERTNRRLAVSLALSLVATAITAVLGAIF